MIYDNLEFITYMHDIYDMGVAKNGWRNMSFWIHVWCKYVHVECLVPFAHFVQKKASRLQRKSME